SNHDRRGSSRSKLAQLLGGPKPRVSTDPGRLAGLYGIAVAKSTRAKAAWRSRREPQGRGERALGRRPGAGFLRWRSVVALPPVTWKRGHGAAADNQGRDSAQLRFGAIVHG